MRSLQVVMLMLCVLGGLFLLVRAPEFFLPAQWDPSIGRSFDPLASRLLGAGLLALAAAGAGYIHAMYYTIPRRLARPGGAASPLRPAARRPGADRRRAGARGGGGESRVSTAAALGVLRVGRPRCDSHDAPCRSGGGREDGGPARASPIPCAAVRALRRS